VTVFRLHKHESAFFTLQCSLLDNNIVSMRTSLLSYQLHAEFSSLLLLSCLRALMSIKSNSNNSSFSYLNFSDIFLPATSYNKLSLSLSLSKCIFPFFVCVIVDCESRQWKHGEWMKNKNVRRKYFYFFLLSNTGFSETC
jgi:hypothetical protein